MRNRLVIAFEGIVTLTVQVAERSAPRQPECVSLSQVKPESVAASRESVPDLPRIGPRYRRPVPEGLKSDTI